MKKSTETARLLTNDERRAYIQKVLGHRLQQPGLFLLPTTHLYDTLPTDTGLQDMLFEICRWLGIKPNGLTVEYADIASDFTTNQTSIQIAASYRNHPFVAGSAVCLAVLSHALLRHTGSAPDSHLVELASLETGLGIWVLNGLSPKQSYFQNVYHAVSGDWHYREGIKLTSYQNAQYAHVLAEWAHAKRIPVEEYVSHIRGSNRYLLPQHIATSILPSLPEPTLIRRRRFVSRMFWVKLFLIVGITALAISVAAYVWSARHPAVSAKQREQEQSLRILRSSFDACILKVTGQRNTYDPNDLLLARQLEATQSRCESLRNEYNYALNQYQAIYTK